MNHRSDIDRAIEVWMADGPTAIPDRVVDVVAARIGVQRQRRAWPFQRRTNVTTPIKLIAALAAALVVAVVGYNLLPRQPDIGGPSTAPPTVAPTTIAPTTAPTAGAATSPLPLPDGFLTGGRYQFEAYGLSIEADVPAGWIGDPLVPYLASAQGFDERDVLISFMLPDGLFSDACHWDVDGTATSAQPGDVEVGPTVEDLVDALQANTSYASSTPSPVSFGEFKGTETELQLPGADVLSTCDIEAGDATGVYYVFAGAQSGGIYAQGPDNRWQLFIVDVGGTRLVILLSYFATTPQGDLEAGRAIVEIVRVHAVIGAR